jgi:hypothetical protein
MAVVLMSGAETADQNADSMLTTGSTFSTANPRSGTYAFRCASGGSNVAAHVQSFGSAVAAALDTSYWGRAYYHFTNLPGTTIRIWASNTGTQSVSVKLTAAGKLQLWDDVGNAQIGSDSAATLTTGTWYRVEVMWRNNTTAATDATELRLDGTSVASASNLTFSTTWTSTRWGWHEAPGANLTCDVDDIVINDGNGAANNTWPGDGKVVMLKPISDNARAALWTGGAGGTTNLFEAVNNTPPIGTATETDLTQIEHAGGAAGTTDAYDANMTSYTTAGVGASDTVDAVQLLAMHGEDIATGTKLLNFEVVSNPAIASTGNVTAGNDIGALGTYPTNWTRHAGTIAQAPSVTKGTSPVMRVRRPETASRVASVCFMAMYVAYTPAVVATSPLPIFQRPWRFWNRRRAF